VIDLFKRKFKNTYTILTCYATFIVVICLNLQASVRLFTSVTNWLVLFCKLDVLPYLNLKSSTRQFKEIDRLWHLFFREQYTFILQTSSDVIDLPCVFYQTIFQHILNGNFVLNRFKRGHFGLRLSMTKAILDITLPW